MKLKKKTITIISSHISNTHPDFDKITSEYRTTIMGLAMISVMLFHQYFTSVIPFNAFHNFGNMGVDVFLFLSGMGLVRSLEKNSLSVYYNRRIKRIIPSCILCGTTKYIIFILLGSSVAVLEEALKLGWWSLASLDLWFIPTILILYAISPLLNYLLRKWLFITISVIVFALFINGLTLSPCIGFDWFSPQVVLSRTIERLPVFTAGMLISIRKDLVNGKLPYSAIFLLIAIGIRILAKSGLSLSGHHAYTYFALTLGMPALIMVNIYILKIVPDILKRCVIFMGEYSLELYLVHEFIFWSLKVIFINVSPWLLLTIGFLLSCLTAYLTKFAIKKVLP